MIGDSLERELRHAVSPKEGKGESNEDQQEKKRIDEPDMPVSIAEAKPGVEITHPISTCR